MIFLPGNVPSLKNSKIATPRGVFSSVTVKKYLRRYGIQSYSSSKKIVTGYKTIPDTFYPYVIQIKQLLEGLERPYLLGFHFVRDSKRAFDFNNATQILTDLFTAYDMIEDDNSNIILPVPLKIDGKFHTIDKENPGVYITIIKELIYEF